mmetsp:Transcript_48188/g.113737  ORF Transcript_48188/g.113737 Transcript_48188/m.113737 type:complete len:247 (+) Transcript_48188:371-1111(+)
MSRINPSLSAQIWDMMVLWAPESTKALTGMPLTSESTYSITTRANDSGLYSIAASRFWLTFSIRIASSISRWASMSRGSALRRMMAAFFFLSFSCFCLWISAICLATSSALPESNAVASAAFWSRIRVLKCGSDCAACSSCCASFMKRCRGFAVLRLKNCPSTLPRPPPPAPAPAPAPAAGRAEAGRGACMACIMSMSLSLTPASDSFCSFVSILPSKCSICLSVGTPNSTSSTAFTFATVSSFST